MSIFEIETNSEHETKEIAETLASLIKPGTVITLEGDLGAGKTTFTKGLAKGLEIKRAVTSPTFTILKQYEGTLTLNHIDAYRLEDSEEDIGLDDYIYGDGVTVIEWAKFIDDFLPTERLALTIEFIDTRKRKLTFQPIGDSYKHIVEQLKEIVAKRGSKK